jgi:hypothetical protein
MGVVTSDLDRRWPAAVVPVVTGTLLAPFLQRAVEQALNFYQRFTAFQFVERTTEEDFIIFMQDEVSKIASGSGDGPGRVGGGQMIHLNPGVTPHDDMVTHVLHELGHALGMSHEHQRPDRDFFVSIRHANIDGHTGDFTIPDEVVLPTSYDYGSRMHYRPGGHAKKGTMTIAINTVTGGPVELMEVIGTSKLLSQRDLETLNYTASPLAGPVLTSHTFETIDDGHQLVAISDSEDLILDWETETGRYRVWRFKADAAGHDNPLITSGLPGGSFPVIGEDHRLLAVDDGMFIDWHPDTGSFRLWSLAQPSIPPSGQWKTIGDDHHLVSLGGRRILDWDDDGNFRLWIFDPTDSNLLAGPLTSGQWETIDGDHQLIALSDRNLLDHDDGDYRVFEINRNAKGHDNPLTRVIAAGEWSSIDDDHVLVPVGKHRVLDWEPDSGHCRVWRYAAKFDAYQPNPLSSATHAARHRSIGGASALEIEDGHLLTWKQNREYQLWRLDYGTGGDALELVREDTFDDNMKDHQLVALPGKRVLDFDPKDNMGTVFEYQLDRAPLWKKKVTARKFKTIDGTHRLIRLSADRVLDWEPATIPDASRVRVREYDSSARGKANPFPGEPKTDGRWQTDKAHMIGHFHSLVPVEGHVLDWVPGAAFYRVWRLDIDRTDESILPMPTLAEGFWSDFKPSTKIIALAGGRIMDWDDDGNYRISTFTAPADPFRDP